MQKTIVIIGSGPAGLTAAIYAARAGFATTIVSGTQPGGQLMLTTEVENYPGFEEGIHGPNLMEKWRKQAEKFGTKFVEAEVTEVDFSTRPFKITTSDDRLSGDAVIIATGATAIWLDLKSEQRLRGKGVSACATCDGFFFRDKEVVVIGGGDTAMEEAIFLTKFASRVTVIHRRNELRASKILQDRAFSNPKIGFIWDTGVEDILGPEKAEGVRMRNLKSGEVSELKCDGVFVAIGHKPNTEVFRGQVDLDDKGFVKKGVGATTSIQGVFVAGDVYDYLYRQAVTAAGSGCRAALDASRYLESG